MSIELKLREAVITVATYIHERKFSAVITSGRSEGIAVAAFDTGWKLAFGENVHPPIFQLEQEGNQLLYQNKPVRDDFMNTGVPSN